jgi:ATP/maltotriose-dependent transcriptional regulator MalT
LHNGLGRYADALAASEQDVTVYVCILVVRELVEAAVRTGNTDVAARALQRLAETTRPSGNDLALGIEARCRALLSEGEIAERRYQEAIDRLGRTQLRPDLARAHLLYGEWLRRQSRRLAARKQLRTAHDMLAAIGRAAFAERARRELTAAGEHVGKRPVEISDDLTAQETLIARLARDGLSNPEIAAQPFISTRTVEWHLRKVFTKLGVSSRGQLQRVLTDSTRPAATSE